jgi:hypothetical protein
MGTVALPEEQRRRATMDNPDRYVGHIVSLDRNVFRRLIEGARRPGFIPDNRFIVAAVSRKLHKLICYNADFRVTVSVQDVVLV